MKHALAVALLLAIAPSISAGQNMERQTAAGACMLFIKKVLHDPDSATFGESREADVYIKGNYAQVFRIVRAKNGFGARRLSEFMCLLEYKDGFILPALVMQKGDDESADKARAIIKKWKLF